MKKLLKYLLIGIASISLFFVLLIIAGIGLIASVAGCSSSSGGGVQGGSVLVVQLSGSLSETADDNDDLGGILGISEAKSLCVHKITDAIDKAAQSKDIKGLYIEAGLLQADYASLQEIRQAIVRFNQSTVGGEKKFSVAYGDEYTQGTYYVCSAANEVWINPQGMIDLHGIAAQPMYLTDLLAKAGISMTVVKVGRYKSATEQYTERQMSDANREQITRYIGNIWKTVTTDISTTRQADTATLNRLADEMVTLQETKQLVASHLVTGTMYANEVKHTIKKKLGLKPTDEIPQISCADMVGQDIITSNDKIAVYCCEGTISQSRATGIAMGGSGIVSKEMVSELDALAKDDNVKAVVIRINSGGGDAFASEEIWHSVIELKKKKPVVVSMGGMAASGAYYLSCGASYIMAQPTTLTGSIGIFGVFPNMQGLMQEKLGLHYDVVKTNAHSDLDMTQSSRSFDNSEMQMLQAYINRGYELFCKRVADGRHIPIEKVKQIAEGRVWTGGDAKSISLVDELGGLPAAIAKAAKLAKVEKYSTSYYPTPPSLISQIFGKISGGDNNLDEELRTTLGTLYEPFCIIRNAERITPIQAWCEVRVR